MDSTIQPSAASAVRPGRRWLRFGLRTLLVAVTVAGMALGLLVTNAERQRRAAAAIRPAGGLVGYDYEQAFSPTRAVELPGPDLLSRLLGVGYFSDVSMVTLPDGAADADVAHLRGLNHVIAVSLAGAQISDASLEHLDGLTRLRRLSLDHTHTTTSGRDRLQPSLPNCVIVP